MTVKEFCIIAAACLIIAVAGFFFGKKRQTEDDEEYYPDAQQLKKGRKRIDRAGRKPVKGPRVKKIIF